MPEDRDQPQLHGYLFGRLSNAEEEELARRALADQAVFDALLEMSGDRELLQDPAFRARLLRQLETREKPSGFWATLFRPGWTLPALAASATVLLALAVSWFGWSPWKRIGPGPEEPLTLITSERTDPAVFFQLPSRRAP